MIFLNFNFLIDLLLKYKIFFLTFKKMDSKDITIFLDLKIEML